MIGPKRPHLHSFAPCSFSCLSCFSWLITYLLTALSVSDRSSAAEPTPAQALIQSPRVLIIAHRGNSSVAPENTLPAFQSALEAKADLVELDYYHSADGVPVVIHDKLLGRTTNAEQVLGKSELAVRDLPLADLRKLDAASWFDEKFAGK